MTPRTLNRRAFGAVSAFSAATLFAPAVLSAQGEGLSSLGRLTVAVGGQGLLYHLPLALADSLGFFRSQGLEIAIRDFPAGALALQAVHEGTADVFAGAFEHTLRAQARGRNLCSLVLQGRATQLALGVSTRALPAYKHFGHLTGHRIGVSSIGSSTHLCAVVVLLRAGLSLQDVTFVAVGGAADAMTAFRSGQVHALCHADPVMTRLEQTANMRIVGDLRSVSASQEVFGGVMPGASLCVPQAFMQKQPAQAQALVDGIVHALKWLQTAAPADLMKALPAAYLMGDRGAYLAAFNRVRDTYSTNGQMPDDGPVIAQRVLSRVLPGFADTRLDVSRTYNNDFVRKARQKYNV